MCIVWYEELPNGRRAPSYRIIERRYLPSNVNRIRTNCSILPSTISVFIFIFSYNVFNFNIVISLNVAFGWSVSTKPQRARFYFYTLTSEIDEHGNVTELVTLCHECYIATGKFKKNTDKFYCCRNEWTAEIAVACQNYNHWR